MLVSHGTRLIKVIMRRCLWNIAFYTMIALLKSFLEYSHSLVFLIKFSRRITIVRTSQTFCCWGQNIPGKISQVHVRQFLGCVRRTVINIDFDDCEAETNYFIHLLLLNVKTCKITNLFWHFFIRFCTQGVKELLRGQWPFLGGFVIRAVIDRHLASRRRVLIQLWLLGQGWGSLNQYRCFPCYSPR